MGCPDNRGRSSMIRCKDFFLDISYETVKHFAKSGGVQYTVAPLSYYSMKLPSFGI
jgi:hypothetical protein